METDAELFSVLHIRDIEGKVLLVDTVSDSQIFHVTLNNDDDNNNNSKTLS